MSHCAAHGWCSHRTCMVCLLLQRCMWAEWCLTIKLCARLLWAIMKENSVVCFVSNITLEEHTVLDSIRFSHIVNLVASWPWSCLFIACHSESLWTGPRLQHVFHSWWQLQLWNYHEQFTIESTGQTHTSNYCISRCCVTHMAKQSKYVIL